MFMMNRSYGIVCSAQVSLKCRKMRAAQQVLRTTHAQKWTSRHRRRRRDAKHNIFCAFYAQII